MGGCVVTDGVVSQAAFGAAVGISQQAVSDLVQRGVLPDGAPASVWLRLYCARLREQAAGRMGEVGGLDLTHERAALAREQRIAQELKNATARGEYAPVSLLTEVLATASQAMAERMDHIPGTLRRMCPDLPATAVDAVLGVLAAARNGWIRDTAELASRSIEPADASDDTPELPGIDPQDDEPRSV